MSKTKRDNNSLSSSSNRDSFVPTWLYVKRCKHCGLMYFGKTIAKDPSAYPGSGSYWRNHLNKYGWENAETVKSKLFNDPEKLNRAALKFSEEHDIVNAKLPTGKKLWANMKHEDGFDGGSVAGTLHKSSRKKMSKIHKDRHFFLDTKTDKVYKLKLDDPLIDDLKLQRGIREETREKISAIHKGKPKPATAVAKMQLARKGQQPYNDGKEYWLLYANDPRIKEEKLKPGLPEWKKEFSRGEKNGMYGKTHTEEVKKKLSEYGKTLYTFATNNPMKNPKLVARVSQRMQGTGNPSYGKNWYNNGIKNFYLAPEDARTKTFCKGMLPRVYWYNDGVKSYKMLTNADKRIKEFRLVKGKLQS